MGTPGSVSIRVVDGDGKSKQIIEIFTKCSGDTAFKLGDKIAGFGRIPSISTLQRWCKKLHFGCDKCRRIVKGDSTGWHEIEIADVVRFKEK